MSKIAINALGLKSGVAGVETYTYNLIKHLGINDTLNQYYIFAGENLKKVFEDLEKNKNIKFIYYTVDTNNSTHRVIAENTLFPIDLIFKRINLVHHVCNYMPYFCPVKSVTTLHDMMAFYYHENYPEFSQMDRFYNYFKKAMAHTAKHVLKILPNSEFTKKEFLKHYDIELDKVEVVRHSIDTRQKIGEAKLEILKEYDIHKPYILAVSAIRPHKNFDFLVRVFNRLKVKYNLPHQLVIIGKNDFGYEKFLQEVDNSYYKKDIICPGFVKNEDMASLYSFCDVLTFPSVYEGFGVPVLESMQYKIPIAASNAASIPEVGGEACIYFNPYDEVDACDKIYSVISDEGLKQSLISKQKNQLEKFDWNGIAKEYIRVYKEVV